MQTMKEVTQVRKEHMHIMEQSYERVFSVSIMEVSMLLFTLFHKTVPLFYRTVFAEKWSIYHWLGKAMPRNPTFFDKTYAYETVTQVKVVHI